MLAVVLIVIMTMNEIMKHRDVSAMFFLGSGSHASADSRKNGQVAATEFKRMT